MLHKKTDHLYGDPLFLYATGDVRTPVPELPKAVEGGAIRVVPQWGIRRRRKRGERVNRNEQCGRSKATGRRLKLRNGRSPTVYEVHQRIEFIEILSGEHKKT